MNAVAISNYMYVMRSGPFALWLGVRKLPDGVVTFAC